MTDDQRPVARPEYFWGAIQLATRIHATTAELWSAIRSAADAGGVTIPQGMFKEVNRLRAAAAQLRNASETLMGGSLTDAITGAMVGQQLYARSGEARSLAPAWHVRFELSTTVGTETSTGWYVMQYQGALPSTIGELYDDLEAYSAGLGESYGVSVGDITAIEIGAY